MKKEDHKAKKAAAELVTVANTELEMSQWQLEESQKSTTAMETGLGEAKRQLAGSQKLVGAMKAGLDEAREQLAESQKSATALKTDLDEMEWQLDESRKSSAINSDRALKAEWANTNLKKQKEVPNKGNERLVEIAFRKQWTSKLGAQSFAAKRLSKTFLEFAMLALKTAITSSPFVGRRFNHKGRRIFAADYNKALAQVSDVFVTTRHFGRSTDVCILAWL